MISSDNNISQRDDAEPSIDHGGTTFSMLGSAAEKNHHKNCFY
jgi:hypothetical protein